MQPVVLDQIGKLYNKVAILEFLLDRTSYGDGESICGYIRSMKVSYQLWLHICFLLAPVAVAVPTDTGPSS